MGKPRILIVEDEIIIARDIEKLLKSRDFEIVEIVSNGQDAIDQADKNNPDLILMDVILDGDIDGVSATEIIRQKHDIPFIFITAHSDEMTLNRIKATEPYGYLAKPVKRDTLYSSVEIALYKHKIEAKLKERVKDLNCLYGISKLIEQPGIEIDEIIQGIVDLIPPAMQYPDIACARIRFKDQTFSSNINCIKNNECEKYHKTSLRRDILVNGNSWGEINIFYNKEGAELQNDPFVKEEKDLLNAITERLGKIIERRQAEETNEIILRTAIDGFYISDNFGHFLKVNDAYCDMVGYSSEELLSMTVGELENEKSLEEIVEHSRLVRDQGHDRFETRHRHRDNSIIDVDVSVNYVPFEEGWFFTFVRDITELKKSRESLRNSEKKYHNLFEYANDSIFVIDPATRGFIDINENAAKRLGYNREELLKMKVNEIDQPMTSVQQKDIIESLEKTGSIIYEHAHRKKDGTVVPVEISSQIFTYDENMVFQNFVRDITKRKETEKQLNNMVTEKETLLKEIQHRVKNNLQIISSILNLQSDYITNERDRELFTNTQNRILSMSLVYELLYQSSDLSKINFSQYADELIHQLINTHSIDPDQIHIAISKNDILLPISQAIPCALIINETISNAIKYAFPEGKKGTIKVDLTIDKSNYQLTISDDGVGLPDRIDFYSPKSPGILLINDFTRQLGGSIEISKESGSHYRIQFPL